MAPNLRIVGVVPVLPALDVERALGFYRDTLGFTDDFAVAGPPADYGGVRRPVVVHFWRCDDPKIPENSSCRLVVGEIADVWKSVQERGVKAIEALAVRPWGFHEFCIVDSEGNLLRFCQPV